MLLILLMPTSLAENDNVDLKLESSLTDSDAGITGAETSPNGESLLIVGLDGFAHLISAKNAGDRSLDIELNSGRQNNFNDVAWHPRGEAALIAGDLGTAMRYEKIDHGITVVNGTGAILGRNMTAVDWRSAGDYSYFGAEDGSLWRFSEGTGFMLVDSVNSEITGISCHKSYDICVVSTLADGLGVIGQTHNISWLSGTKTDTWIDVDCPDSQLKECIAYGSGLRLMPILLNTIDHSNSDTGEMVQYPSLDGDFISTSPGYASSSLIHVAPFATVRYDALENSAKVQISSDQMLEWDSVIAGRQIAHVWETGFNDGYIMTTSGNIISFEPKLIEIDNTMLTTIILVAVSVSVPGVILGLIYMNSPFLQKKYINFRRNSRRKKSQKNS
jgi:WD40 repeat protein